MARRFELSLTLGTADMKTGADVAAVLGDLADALMNEPGYESLDPKSWRTLRDAKGRTAGGWKVEER